MADDYLNVYDEHVWNVYGFFAYRLNRREDAEDLTQLTFERALKAWERYDERRSQPLTWLLAIAQNVLIDHYRKTGRSPVIEAELEERMHPVTPGPESNLGLSAGLAEALEVLGPREREVLALRFGADLKAAQIAELLDLSAANVHQILSRSLRQLRRLLEHEHVT